MHERRVSALSIERATGVHNTTISRWKSGERSPQGEELALVAKFLETTTDALLAGALVAPATVQARAPAEQMSEELKEAIADFKFPGGTTTMEMYEFVNALFDEAFAVRGTYIPKRHWENRLAELVAAKKGKRIENPASTASPDEEDPDVAAHKAAAKKRRRK